MSSRFRIPYESNRMLHRPEKHTHNAVPVEHKVHDHRDDKNISAKLEREAAKFKDSTTTHSTTHTSSTAPVVGGEHTHHHVHEHIQPVIQKETVAPEVVHTTVPIHETHHQEAIHHGTHVLPTKTMEEFSNNREIFDGRAKSKVTEFEGCPSDYNKNLREDHPHTHERGAHSHGVNSSEIGSGSVGGRTGTRSQGLSNSEIEPRAGVETGGRRGLGSDSTTEGSIAQKPSLKDRLNPFKDADGDGKKGLMD